MWGDSLSPFPARFRISRRSDGADSNSSLWPGVCYHTLRRPVLLDHISSTSDWTLKSSRILSGGRGVPRWVMTQIFP